MAEVVLDASAILAVLNRERGADVVMADIDGAAMSTVNYAEVATKLFDTGKDFRVAKEAIRSLGVRIVDFDQDLAERVGELRPLTRHRGLSLGDRACIALAERNRVPALTADRRWGDAVPTVDIRLFR
jgi:PIN domain nuclease of toxin-antitoxin system